MPFPYLPVVLFPISNRISTKYRFPKCSAVVAKSVHVNRNPYSKFSLTLTFEVQYNTK